MKQDPDYNLWPLSLYSFYVSPIDSRLPLTVFFKWGSLYRWLKHDTQSALRSPTVLHHGVSPSLDPEDDSDAVGNIRVPAERDRSGGKHLDSSVHCSSLPVTRESEDCRFRLGHPFQVDFGLGRWEIKGVDTLPEQCLSWMKCPTNTTNLLSYLHLMIHTRTVGELRQTSCSRSKNDDTKIDCGRRTGRNTVCDSDRDTFLVFSGRSHVGGPHDVPHPTSSLKWVPPSHPDLRRLDSASPLSSSPVTPTPCPNP